MFQSTPPRGGRLASHSMWQSFPVVSGVIKLHQPWRFKNV
jgi:hypothetical protein